MPCPVRGLASAARKIKSIFFHRRRLAERTPGDIIGTVEWSFLEKLLEESSTFYLAGRAWLVERIEWKKKRVMVAPSPGGRVPKWGGITPCFLSYELCRKMRDILVGTDDYPYLDSEAKELLKAKRNDQQALLSSEFAPIAHDNKGIIWWTWAGGNINNTLRTVLKIELAADVQACNEYVKVKSKLLKLKDYHAAIRKISDPRYWKNPELIRTISSMVPNYRFSKFQPYLPEELQLRLVAETVFDFEGTVLFLKCTHEFFSFDFEEE